MSENGNPTYLGKPRCQHTLLKRTRIGNFFLHAQQVLSVATIQSFQLKASFYKTEKHPTVEWLLKKVERILPNRPDELRIDLMDATSHENDIQFRIEGLQLFHQLEPVHLGHLNIQNSEVRLERLGQPNGLAR